MTRSVLTDAIEVTFLDTRKLIYETVKTYHSVFGGEFDELFGEACLTWIIAYWSHRDGRSLFSTWMANRIRWRLLDCGRRRKEHTNSQERLDEIEWIREKHIEEVLEEISSDSRKVCLLVLETDIQKFRKACKTNGQRPLELLTWHLSCYEGWSYPRINRTFKEIRGALIE